MTSYILGIESSCDDTAAALLALPEEGADDARVQIASSVVYGQDALHAAYGGVVPEIAARAHTEKLDLAVEAALSQAGAALDDVAAVAVTAGPGLIGGVLAGVMCAKGLATALDVPLIGVNHLAGHALTPHLTDGLAFPYLMLLVSGGHCQLLVVEGAEQFRRLGGTIDDAPGEAFDKTARVLGLPQPGGPAVEAEARAGDASVFTFPRPLRDREGCDLSFSGLKTALRRSCEQIVAQNGGVSRLDRANLCAGFQSAVCDVLVSKSRRALEIYLSDYAPASPAFAVAGGVAANAAVRAGLQGMCAERGVQFAAPPLALCTDNAAMIAYAGWLRWKEGAQDDNTLAARPRWPLDTKAQGMLGGGRKGAKA